MAGFGIAASPVLAKTAKECQAEWQAHKDIFQPKGITEHDYIDECRNFPTAPPETSAVATPVPGAALPAELKPARAAVAPDHPSTEAGAAKPKKPENTKHIASDELKPKVSQESNRSDRNGNAQLGAVARPPPAPTPTGNPGLCMTRSSGTIIHGTERCP
jgi:hypothetical protein